MASTYELIYSATVGAGGATDITFSSIPSTYTDLIVKLSTRVNSADVQTKVYFNSDTTAANYSWKRIYGDGSSATSDSGTNLIATSSNPSNFTASTYSNSELYIPNYTSSDKKSVSSDAVTENNGTIAYATLAASLWQGTAVINAITLLPNSGSFVQYSTAYLYGVKSS